MPFTAEKILRLLDVEKFGWDQLGNTALLKPGHRIGTPALLFEKIEDSVIEAQLEKLAATKRANLAKEAGKKVEPQKESIAFDDFGKMDIRVGDDHRRRKDRQDEKVVEADYRYRDRQTDDRVGIAEHYTPESLVGGRCRC